MDKRDGKVYVYDENNNRLHELKQDDPKVFAAPTNCEFARIGPERDSIALGLMRNCGAYQIFGWIQPVFGLGSEFQNYGGQGWKWYALSARHPFMEAYWMSQIATAHRLEELGQRRGQDPRTKEAGDLMLSEGFIAYGDPAVESRLDTGKNKLDLVEGLEITKKEGGAHYRFSVKTTAEGPMQREPIIEVPKGAKITGIKTDLKHSEGDGFVLLGTGRNSVPAGTTYSIEFDAKKK